MESENWSQKLLFLRKSFRSTLTFKAVKWQPVIERIQADSKFTVTAEHLYTAVWCRAPRVAYCLSSFQLVTHRPGAAGSSWLRAAVHQQLLSSACLDRVKNFRPFWHDLPPFLYTLNPSCSPSPGTDRESFGNVSKRKNIDIARAAASALWPSPTQTKHHQRTSKPTQTSWANSKSRPSGYWKQFPLLHETDPLLYISRSEGAKRF